MAELRRPNARFGLDTMIALLLAFVLVVTVSTVAQAQTPMLRIETGGHGAATKDASADASGRVLVTASDDKTARLWSLPDLRPLGVLRPPIGDGAEGKLYTVAVSPDGTLAAVGGWTSPTNNQSVLVFDVATKQMVHRIAGLPNVVTSLAFSRDGRLAAGLGVNGLRVWETSGWRQSFVDPGYKDDVYGLSFAPDGRPAAGSLDGALRLYDPAGQRIARASVPAGQRPARLAFNPDGSRLAVGFENALAIEVRDGKTLAVRARPDVTGLAGRGLAHVAWSSDGDTLLATGDVLVNGTRPVFAWDGNGAGARRVLDAGFGEEKTFAIVPLASGTALVSERGALAVLDRVGQRIAKRPVTGQDLNTSTDPAGITRHLPLSRDGTQVAWVALGAQDRWLRFDGASIDLTTPPSRPTGLADWSDNAGTVRMTDYFDSETPKLNGRALGLTLHEQSYSVAVSADRILLGSNWLLRLFVSNGMERWNRAIPSDAYRVNQSADGRLAVAAYADGTLRWHRLSDGQELLALFVTADAARWIAWTPSGYYAAGPGAEDLIGWHVNRGLDQAADFFAASKFRDRFSRPDIVRHVLATLDEAEAVRQADAERNLPSRPAAPITDDLPPVIAISAPRDGTQLSGGEVTIDYTLRSPSARPVRTVRVLLDGRPAPTTRGLDRVPATAGSSGETHGQVVVAIPPGTTVDVALLAETETRTSEAARVRLVGALVATVAEVPRPRLNVVAIGVSAYPDVGMRLQFAAKDATDFASVMASQRDGGLYREVNVTVLTDAQATRAAVVRELDQLRRRTTSNDVAVVFLAGHGMPDEGRTFFLPVDGNPDSLYATAVAQTDLDGILSRIPGKVVTFIDICHAGSAVFAQLGQRGLPDIDGLVNQLRQTGSGVIVFAAATSRQPAIELPALGHGVFTSALLEGLGGGADYKHRGSVRTDELNVFIADRVRELTNGKQSPVMQRPSDVPDFPFALVRR